MEDEPRPSPLEKMRKAHQDYSRWFHEAREELLAKGCVTLAGELNLIMAHIQADLEAEGIHTHAEWGEDQSVLVLKRVDKAA